MESVWYGVRMSKYSLMQNSSYLLRYPNLSEEEKDLIVEFVKDKVCQPYDYKLFIGLALNKLFGFKTKWNDKSAYICDELIAEAFKSIGKPLCGKEPDELTPTDLYNSPLLEHIV
jgi:uncharacterized protein YycO